jgi:hypothetical protein
VAQGIGPEFKPLYPPPKKEGIKEICEKIPIAELPEKTGETS